MKMYALLTNQGTAAGESALCEKHYEDSALRDEARVLANAGGDIDVSQPFTDCTGNDDLQCIACSTAGGGGMSHTPGPWALASYPDGSIVVYSPSTDAYEVARIVAAEDEPAPAQVNTTADARLIAAAPDLLAAAYAALLEGDMTLLGPAIDKATE